MLPGFRFLFAAILLSMSILVFGLGAAALLRAAHEEFASNPSWRGAPETMFAQQAEATRPVLAMLRVEPAAAEAKPSENTRAVAMPTEQAASIAPPVQAPTEQAAAPPPPTGPERIAALRPEEASLPEAARPEIPALESPAQSETAPAPADAPAAADANKIPTPTAADETKVASTEQVFATKPARRHPSRQAFRLRRTPIPSQRKSPRSAVPPSPSKRRRQRPSAQRPTRAPPRSACRRGERPTAAGLQRAPGRRNWRDCYHRCRPTRLLNRPPSRRRRHATPESGRTGCDRWSVGQAPFGPGAVIER